MDINYLLRRQQIETMRADDAACRCSRMVHQQLANLYSQRIDTYSGRAARIAG
ncbi:hypothetical protein [Sphingomonas montanisoli]|uniref:hypothetical protein n=1 Tax=Sphingomonas montanisoli TaxID=2606412 RepID=UPI0015E17D28|nr:hypothetical protein [Sphingomonas montanisoli]